MFIAFFRSPRAAGLFALLATSVLVVPAEAEPAPPYGRLLDGLERSAPALEADALQEAAAARLQQARARPNPSLTLEAENAFGSGSYSGYGNAETTLSFSQPLEGWGRRAARIEAARAEAHAAKLRGDESRWLAAGRLALAYVEAEAAGLHHELALDALALTTEDGRAAQTLVDEGREAPLRAVQSGSEVALAQASVEEARAILDGALARLTALAGLERPVTSIRVSLLDRVPVAGAPAVAELPATWVAEAELDALRRRVTVERALGRPDVTASLGLRRFEASRDEALTLGFSVSLPLFDRNRGAIGAALAEQRAAEARLLAQRQQASAERRALLAGLEASTARTRATEHGVAAAEEAYRLARIGFGAGRISQLELRSFRAALIAARMAAVDARLARARAEIELARLEGRAPFGEIPR